jgi:hypothetical protein
MAPAILGSSIPPNIGWLCPTRPHLAKPRTHGVRRNACPRHVYSPRCITTYVGHLVFRHLGGALPPPPGFGHRRHSARPNKCSSPFVGSEGGCSRPPIPTRLCDFPSDFMMCVKNPHARKLAEAMRKQVRKHPQSHRNAPYTRFCAAKVHVSCKSTTCAETRGSDAEAKCGSKPFINTQAQEFRHTPICSFSMIIDPTPPHPYYLLINPPPFPPEGGPVALKCGSAAVVLRR